MTREEAIVDIRDNIKPVVGGKSLDMAIEALEQESCGDAISRESFTVSTICEGFSCNECSFNRKNKGGCILEERVKALPSIQPKTGRWERMSDLPNDVDDRFKCSRCGNIVHYNNVMDLRTFSRWCGRCGSDNG